MLDRTVNELRTQSDRPRRGLSRRQLVFIHEKLLGLNDKAAALAAGYALSVAENTKQKVWKPQVRAEFERLKARFDAANSPHDGDKP